MADDDAVIRQLIYIHLAAAGFGVILAPGGAAALELAALTSPAVAVLDAGMPWPGGREVAAILRASPATATVRTILLWPDGGGRHEAADGPDTGLAKPFSPAELVALVRELAEPARPACRAAGNSTGWCLRLSCRQTRQSWGWRAR